jgi:hypothetical protein
MGVVNEYLIKIVVIEYQVSSKRKLSRLYQECLQFTNLYQKGFLARDGFGIWSGKRDSNPRPLPWQGNALPTELFPHS